MVTMTLAVYVFILFLILLITPPFLGRASLRSHLEHLPSVWSRCLSFIITHTTPTRFKVQGLNPVSRDHSYLIIANHQSWLDIIIMQHIFDSKLPQLRYFMKRELLYIPFMGFACYILGYPFMKRYSPAYLERHPEKKGQDIETTRETCKRFLNRPITLINFVEGTRFTPKKQVNSHFQHLLNPKSGGIALTLQIMDGRIQSILNVTICYSEKEKIMQKFLAGEMKDIQVLVEHIPVTPDLIGDYQHDAVFKKHFQQWLSAAWARKDEILHTFKQEHHDK
jgi:1-acyl-sn-glycerol-3-phosphate acyltransferase